VCVCVWQCFILCGWVGGIGITNNFLQKWSEEVSTCPVTFRIPILVLSATVPTLPTMDSVRYLEKNLEDFHGSLDILFPMLYTC